MNKEDLLEHKEYLNNLYDVYKNLFTEKQKEYFEAYFFDDLSLSEIASINNVSRNAIFTSLKSIQNLLEEYEEKLSLYKIKKSIDDILSNENISLEEIKAKLKEL